VLLTGAGGLLGTRLAKSIAGKYQVFLHHHHLPHEENTGATFAGDLSDLQHVNTLAAEITPDIIINCAALADVDRCETESEISHDINVKAVDHLLSRFPAAKFVHISTDYVFDGGNRQGLAAPKPNDPTHPINVYGQHKLNAERATLAASKNNLVVRVNTLYDHINKRNYFRFAYDKMSAGENIYGLIDQISNPISAFAAAHLIIRLIEKDAAGIFHLGGREFVSRYDFARRIASFFDFNSDLITSATLETFPRPANRPRNAGLDCRITEQFLQSTMPKLDDEFSCIAKELRNDTD
jgi:dTDP-4-dehydrorhamnose reductase